MKPAVDRLHGLVAQVPWMTLFIGLLLLLYVVAYHSSVFVPGHSNPLGWWGWWDQSQYLRSADALAHGNLDPAEHWYPLGYPLLGAAFFYWVPLHAYFVPNALCFLAFGVALVQMAHWLGLSRIWGAVAFLAGAAFPSLMLEQYVIPWNTVPLAAAYGWILALYLRCLGEGCSEARMAGLALLFVAVIAVRPPDVLPLVPVAVHLAMRLFEAWRDDASRATAVAAAAWGGATVLAGLAAYGALHVAIYGWAGSPYMEMASKLGFDVPSIPYKYALIFGDPRDFYGTGQGVFGRYPIAVLGLFGVIYALLFDQRARVVSMVVVASVGLYLAFTDFHPGNVWHYKLIHYLVWTLPVALLLAFSSATDAVARRRWAPMVVALVVTAMFATVSLRTRADASLVRVIVRDGALTLQSDRPSRVLAYRIDGVRKANGRTSPPLYVKALVDGAEWSAVSHYRVSEVGDSTFVLLNRPHRVGRFELPLELGADATGATAVALVPRPVLALPRRWREDGAVVARVPALRDQQSAVQRCPGEAPRPGAEPALDSDFLRLAYQTVLGRAPDASGFEGGCRLLVTGTLTRTQLLRSMVDSDEFRAKKEQGP